MRKRIWGFQDVRSLLAELGAALFTLASQLVVLALALPAPALEFVVLADPAAPAVPALSSDSAVLTDPTATAIKTNPPSSVMLTNAGAVAVLATALLPVVWADTASATFFAFFPFPVVLTAELLAIPDAQSFLPDVLRPHHPVRKCRHG